MSFQYVLRELQIWYYHQHHQQHRGFSRAEPLFSLSLVNFPYIHGRLVSRSEARVFLAHTIVGS